MESRGKKVAGVRTRKKSPSLGVKSLYKDGVSYAGESEKKTSKEKDEQGIKKKGRKNKKEVSLGCFEPDLKKTRKEGDVDGSKVDFECGEKVSDRCKGLRVISLTLAKNGNTFNIPKRPQGPVGRLKLESDQDSRLLPRPNSAMHMRALNADVAKAEILTSDQLDKLVTIAEDNDAVSSSNFVGNVYVYNSEIKQKTNSKSANRLSSNIKLKPKAAADRNGKSCSAGDAERKYVVAVNNEDTLSKISLNLKLKHKARTDRNGRPSSIDDGEKELGVTVNNGNSSSKVASNLKLKRKVGANRSGGSCSVVDAEKELGMAANNGDSSSKVRLTNSRKRRDSVDGRGGGKALQKKLEPSVGNMTSDKLVAFDEEEDDDDEENLEQNAARMLSSRFDPSCTGFTSKPKSSALQKANISVVLDHVSDDDEHRADNINKALRPRREEDKGKDIPRRRRHFYDVLPRNLEPNWFLDKKIKVFWPLDGSWYFGIVKDYHPEFKLYQIKYDDGDDEWIDLHAEKFKVLLFRNELPKNAKPKSSVNVLNDIDKVETVPPEAEDVGRENCPDSESIASWLARSFRPGKSSAACSSQPGKSSQKLLETPRTSRMELPTVSLFSYENAIDLNSKVIESKRAKSKGYPKPATTDKSVAGSANGICAVYVRKHRKKSKTYGSPSEIVNPIAPVTDNLVTLEEHKLCFGFSGSNKQLCSVDHHGKQSLNGSLESRKLNYQICLPLFPSTRSSLGLVYFCLLRDELMIQHGLILPASPPVALEILFLDASLGLKFFLFDGCLKPAIALIIQILNLFSILDQPVKGNKNSPVTSIRFRLSNVQDLRKHHAFEVHCFSRLQSSHRVCLDSLLKRDCILLKQLSVSECTYDNIKELEQWKPHDGSEPSSHSGFNKRFAFGILPFGVSKEACTAIHSHPLNLARKPGIFLFSFSATPTIYLMLHLRLLMEKSVGILPQELVDVPLGRKGFTSRLDSDACCCANKGFTRISNATGSGCSRKSGRSCTISSLRNLSPTRPARSPKFMSLGFPNGLKKPRTQVQYTIPDASYDFSSKQKTRNKISLPCKRIRKSHVKKMPANSLDNSKNFELLVCGANVLVTNGDRGWRECRAFIVLEGADHKEWILAIKISGVTKYSYKVNHILQPGTINRYSHAMLWKGAKNWQLEFPDRSKWNLFKEMHEECFNRNIRAASVKHTPIPGVKLIEGCNDYGSDVSFFRNSTEYFKQVQNDVEMALDPLHTLYDMDSDDEQWSMANKKYISENICEELSNEVLEQIMDMFEKVSYVKHRDCFTAAEIQEIVNGLVSVEAAKEIYEHWQEKRRRKSMPLIRHLQPPLWQRYQQQLKEWENAVTRCNSAVFNPPKKPPTFAFCLKPRNVDVPNKGSKQRSHRKFPISRYHYGKRSYGHIFGDEKVLYPNSVHDFLDLPPSLWPSSLRMSPPQSKLSQRLSSNKHRKVGWSPSLKNPLNVGDYFHTSDMNELQFRDASSAAQYALNVAKMKREKARRLFNRADVAAQKALAALMTADAIKAAYENSNGDVGDRSIHPT